MVNKDLDFKEYDYSKCGWTDKGVSAAGNYFSIRLLITEKERFGLINWINSALPNDIIIINCH